ncbi:MAG: exopolyphosphatase [Planctomycetota bacterium]|nr:exopolyphosphatase [Planctomycetota bacterium]
MRIITRGDMDGLASSVLLTVAEDVKEILFVHPKDAQDGLIQATKEDIVVNLPFIKGCGLWFDHHISEEEKLKGIGKFKGRFEMAPSAARVIYNHYKKPEFERFKEMLEAIDRFDSAQLSPDDVSDPKGWILLGYTIDPRTGFGPEFQKYFRWLVEYIKEVPLEVVLKHKEVKKRCDRVLADQVKFKEILSKHSRQDGNVILTDLRALRPGSGELAVGNRFLVYTMFPKADVEVRLFGGKTGAVVVAVGHSIFNRTCKVNVGNLMKEFGGGGHAGAGTCQLKPESAEENIGKIIARVKK